MHLTVCSCHVTKAFLSESTLYICLNVKGLLARTRGNIWNLSDSNGSRPQKHLICKWTLNILLKLTEWWSRILSTYLYRAFDCMFLSCPVHVWEWIHTLYLPECQGTPCSKQARYLTFKWLQRDSNPEPLSLSRNTQPFGWTDQMIELNCEFFFVWSIWLYVLVMSRTPLRVNPHSIFVWMSRNFFLKTDAICEV